MMNFKLEICLLVVLSIVPYTVSIKCWDCRSDSEPKCGDPFDNSTLPITDCSQELPGVRTMCRKVKQKVNGEWTHVRGCAQLDEVDSHEDEQFCITRNIENNILTEYCTCYNKDGCNISYKFTPKPMLMVLLAVAPSLTFRLVV